MLIRLDKYLADMGLGTRSQVKELIKKGKININGIVIKDGNLKVDSHKDIVYFEGNPIVYEEFEYYMLNKPSGVISASNDKHEKTVVDLITDKKRDDLFPIGRLDKDTEGLLIISNDGELSHNLLSPKKHINKTYYAELDKPLSKDKADKVCEGVYIEAGVKSMPAKLEYVNDINDTKVYLTIHEGKYHQVKRMFQAVGCKVTYLKRISMGPLKLDDKLQLGEYRRLTIEEVEALKKCNI
ncbi:MAG: rRNA pseudouridine synthase [Lachnospiraceae bacterium]|nr:rRNA pseudouridine synthase [Lachnospiraceae bacterium]